MTSKRPASDQQVTTNKNVKNKNLTSSGDEASDINPTTDQMRLAHYLFKYIKRNIPNKKEPNFRKWAEDFDRLLRIDKRPLDEVKDIIAWCQRDPFWMTNILSPGKLRKKYDELWLKKKNEKLPKNKYGVVVPKSKPIEGNPYADD